MYVEDLKVANMSKSANKQKSGLNLDQSWFEFRLQLEYKLAWNGGFLFAVPPQNTSRCCPNCGHTAKDNRQMQAEFKCGYQNNVDVVGAINVLKRGQAFQSA